MNFQQFFGWFWNPVRNHYADFHGRATRQEFWMYVLIYVIIYVILAMVNNVLTLVYSLALLVPGIAITARRLHDTGLSGWWQLLGLIPLIGWIIVIVLCVRKSNPAGDKYGMASASGASVTPSMTPTPTSMGGGSDGQMNRM